MFKLIRQSILAIYSYVKAYVSRKTWSMAIVRRYADANGAYVGELYLLGTFAGVLQYSMIGVSLDTLPFEAREVMAFSLDTKHDFLVPMPERCVRVGASMPEDNDVVRAHVARLASTGTIVLQVQNRFVEHVMSRPGKGE